MTIVLPFEPVMPTMGMSNCNRCCSVECLQACSGEASEQKVGGGVVRLCVVGEGAHHKVVDAAAIEVVDVAMAVARAGAEGKNKVVSGKTSERLSVSRHSMSAWVLPMRRAEIKSLMCEMLYDMCR